MTPAADGGIAKPDVVAPPKPQQRGVPSIALGLVPAGPDALPEGGKSVLELYLAGVEARVRPHWPPPEMTRAMGEAAASAAGARREVVMRVRIGRDGALEGVSVGTSAGLAVVDRAAAAALERGAPFSGLPSAVQDDEGGLTFYFRFPLELPLKIFAAAVKRIVGAQWQPSVAFRHRGDRDRVTVVRAQLQADGLLAAATLESSSGLGMLDDGALAAFKKGMRFPPPPESLREVAGVVAVRIGFLHSVRGTPEVRVLRTP